MPRIFIGSSVEGLPVARAIRSNLERDAQITLWNEGVFRLSQHSLESISEALSATDFGVFVLTPDDTTVLRGEERSSVRDNVILELGMSIGYVGRLRTFIVQPRGANYHLPTDLLGITVATYDADRSGEWEAALGAACDQIRRELTSHVPTFPSFGNFGMNILSDKDITVLPNQEYSLAVEIPHGIDVSISLFNKAPLSSGLVPWRMRLGASRGIDHDVAGERSQRFWNTASGRIETPIEFIENGAAEVVITSGGTEISRRTLTW